MFEGVPHLFFYQTKPIEAGFVGVFENLKPSGDAVGTLVRVRRLGMTWNAAVGTGGDALGMRWERGNGTRLRRIRKAGPSFLDSTATSVGVRCVSRFPA